MNLFITSFGTDKCARALDDKRLGKQILECGQMLSTALHARGYRHPDLYKPMGRHPVTLWVGQSQGNALFTLYLMLSCGEEYQFRFKKRHKTMDLTFALSRGIYLLPEGQLVQFLNYAKNVKQGLDFTQDPYPIHAYQEYLKSKWDREIWGKRKPRWTACFHPSWWEEPPFCSPF